MRKTALCFHVLFVAAICVAIISFASLDARAQTNPSDPCPGKIIKASCTNADVAQFESDSVQAFLAFHGLPSTDSTVLYTYGRYDVRDEVRAFMLVKLIDIIHRHYTGSPVSSSEFGAYQWFSGLIKTSEQAMYSDAVALRNSYKNNPCNWLPDPVIANLYGLTYIHHPCGILDVTYQSSEPTESYFLAAGLKKAYGDPLVNAVGANLMADMDSRTALLWAGAATAKSATAATGIGLLSSISSNIQLGTELDVDGNPINTNLLGYYAFFSPAMEAIANIGLLFNPPNLAADQAVFESILRTTQWVEFESATASDFQAGLNDLDTLNSNAVQQDPDLDSFLSTELGVFKLSATLALATLPEDSSTNALPSHTQGSYPTFVITPETGTAIGSDTFQYRDWYGILVSAQTYGNWFIETESLLGLQISFISPTIEFVGLDGVQYFATLLPNSQFMIAPRTDFFDRPGQLDQLLTFCQNFFTSNTVCGEYLPTFGSVAGSLYVKSGDSDANVSFAIPPGINAPASTYFPTATDGTISGTVSIQTTGSPTPTVSLVVSPSAPNFQITSGNGSASVVVNPSSPVPQGLYTITIQAQNLVGTVSRTVTVLVGTPSTPSPSTPSTPQFTSVLSQTLTYGLPSIVGITAAGNPAPTISYSTVSLPTGLSMQGNNSSEPVLSGTPTDPDSCGQSTQIPLTATSSIGQVTSSTNATLTFKINCATSGQLVEPSNLIFIAGTPNNLTVASTGGIFEDGSRATIQMNCNVDAIPDLSWLICTDNGDGTATLSGTPPYSETLNHYIETHPWVQPHALGSISDIIPPAPGVYIAPRPLFSSLPDAVFYSGKNDATGTPMTFSNSPANYVADVPNTTFTETGYVPSAVTFASSNGGFTLNYDLSTGGGAEGGAYPVTIVGSPVYGMNQNLPMTIYVFSPPQITSAASATVYTGQGNTFSVLTDGFPKVPITGSNNPNVSAAPGMVLSVSGTLPSGITFSSSYGSGSFSGTPCATCTGTYPLTIQAANAAGGAVQQFTLIAAAPQVAKTTPTITWTPPAPIYYGTALSATQLSATANVSGTFVYNPPLNTILPASNNQSVTLNASFTPTDTTDYASASATNSIMVYQATPSVGWQPPAAITQGTALSGAQLDAASSVSGTIVYSPAAGTVLPVGKGQMLSATFTPTDMNDYMSVIVTTTIDVNPVKTTPSISWANPSDIAYGTPLSTTQLNASSSVPGTLTYTPPLGTLLQAGNSQSLSVSFVPSDSSLYFSTNASVQINVTKLKASVTPGAASKSYGSADPALGGTLSGFLPADGITATYSRTPGDTVAGSPYTISATLNDPLGKLNNYTLTSNTAAFTINRLGATVTAGGGTKVYGATDPALTPTTQTGFLTNDVAGITLNTTRAQGAAVGNYPTTATATGGAVNNYNITYVPGNFSITPALLTVTANSATRVYGTSNPAFTTSITGFVNGDTSSAVSGSAALSTTATPTSLPGTYPISIAQGTLSAANYTFTLVGGNLTITPTAPAPVSGNGCNGAYTGSFNGNLTVSNGQTCVFYGGGNVSGNIQLNGGNLMLIGQQVKGNVQGSGNSTITITGGGVGGNVTMQNGSSSLQISGTRIDGNLIVQSLSSNSGPTTICGSTFSGNLTLQNNGGMIQIGGGTASCASNTITGNTIIQSNTGAVSVFNNMIDKNLDCQSNSSITGSGNTAKQKQGQCAAF